MRDEHGISSSIVHLGRAGRLHLLVDVCGNEYILPYLERELGRFDFSDAEAADTPKAVLRVTTFETRGNASHALDAEVEKCDMPLLTLNCPYVVGTGMSGLLHRIAASIYAGRFVHIKGNEARVSVVHAVDVARAAALASGQDAAYNITDGSDTTMQQLAEALAYRIDNKRIVTIKPLWARLWLGSDFCRQLTGDHLLADDFGEAYPHFSRNAVTEYLRTHDYDEESL